MASRLTTFLIVVIVGGTLIAGLIVGAQRDDLNGPVDLIITNGHVFTGKPGVFAEAVAIRGNKILRIGSNREIKRLRRPQTEVLDAHGSAVLPGFNDASADLIHGGLALADVDLSAATSIPALETAVADFAAAHPERAWVVGHGWSYDLFADAPPTRQQLDTLVPDRPAMLTSADGHTAWVNSKALALAHVTHRTAQPPQGTIVKDARTGEPTGVLEESAAALVGALLPVTSNAERINALRTAVTQAQASGVTSVQTVVESTADLDLFVELQRAGELDLRVYAAIPAPGSLKESDLPRIEAVLRQHPDDPVFKSGAVSLTMDGAAQTRGAALHAPHANSLTQGDTRVSAADLQRSIAMLDRRGWQVWVESTGDGSTRLALDAIAQAQAANPRPARGRRHRIDGLDIVDASDLSRFATLGVIAAPRIARADPATLPAWRDKPGDEHAAQGWQINSLIATGAHVALGTSWPSAPMDLRRLLYLATTRTDDERVALDDAVTGVTMAGAYASFDEQRKGRLEVGMLADLVVLTSDIFESGASLLETDVALTIFDGRIVFDRAQARQPTE
jgi:predicted amidohydrolase YtcJ